MPSEVAGDDAGGTFETRTFSSIFAALRNFRQETDFCDVGFVVERKKFYAHKVILAASSEYFRAMFLGSMAENELSVINLYSVDPSIFGLLLDFIYGSSLEISCENAQDIIVAADMLRLTSAVEACESFMVNHIDVANCIGLHSFSKQHAFPNLMKASWDFILSNFCQVALQEEFVMASFETLNCLAESEQIAVASECDVMSAIIRWLAHDPRNRRKQCVALLKHVRIHLLTACEISKVLSEVKDMCLKVAITVLTQNSSITDGSFVKPQKPRLHARKSFYTVGGSVPRRQRKHTWDNCNMEVVSFVERHDSFSHEWDQYPLSLREPRTCPAVVQMDRKLYAIGGEKDSMVYGDIECYDTSTRTWKRDIPSMTIPRTSCQAVAYDCKIYIMGGNFGSGAGKSIEVYDPIKNICQPVNFAMQTARHSFGAVCYGGVLYIAGGIALSERELRTMECYDICHHDWWYTKDMATKRANFGLVNVGPMIYAIGGHNEDQGTLQSVEVFDVYRNCWMPCAPMNQPRAGAFVSLIDSRIVVVGGKHQVRDDQGRITWQVLGDSETYDPNTDNWTRSPCMDMYPRCDGGAVVI